MNLRTEHFSVPANLKCGGPRGGAVLRKSSSDWKGWPAGCCRGCWEAQSCVVLGAIILEHSRISVKKMMTWSRSCQERHPHYFGKAAQATITLSLYPPKEWIRKNWRRASPGGLTLLGKESLVRERETHSASWWEQQHLQVPSCLPALTWKLKAGHGLCGAVYLHWGCNSINTGIKGAWFIPPVETPSLAHFTRPGIIALPLIAFSIGWPDALFCLFYFVSCFILPCSPAPRLHFTLPPVQFLLM